jgi:hypothetical protein
VINSVDAPLSASGSLRQSKNNSAKWLFDGGCTVTCEDRSGGSHWPRKRRQRRQFPIVGRDHWNEINLVFLVSGNWQPNANSLEPIVSLKIRVKMRVEAESSCCMIKRTLPIRSKLPWPRASELIMAVGMTITSTMWMKMNDEEARQPRKRRTVTEWTENNANGQRTNRTVNLKWVSMTIGHTIRTDEMLTMKTRFVLWFRLRWSQKR